MRTNTISMKTYLTDLSDSQWQFIKKTLNFNERKGQTTCYKIIIE